MMSYACAVRRLLDYALSNVADAQHACVQVLQHATFPDEYPLLPHVLIGLDPHAKEAALAVLVAVRATGVPPHAVVPEAQALLAQLCA
jgi:hypothetical protein